MTPPAPVLISWFCFWCVSKKPADCLAFKIIPFQNHRNLAINRDTELQWENELPRVVHVVQMPSL
jgi:hypothetical protein